MVGISKNQTNTILSQSHKGCGQILILARSDSLKIVVHCTLYTVQFDHTWLEGVQACKSPRLTGTECEDMLVQI